MKQWKIKSSRRNFHFSDRVNKSFTHVEKRFWSFNSWIFFSTTQLKKSFKRIFIKHKWVEIILFLNKTFLWKWKHFLEKYKGSETLKKKVLLNCFYIRRSIRANPPKKASQKNNKSGTRKRKKKSQAKKIKINKKSSTRKKKRKGRQKNL